MARKTYDELTLKKGFRLAKTIQNSRKSLNLTQEELAIQTGVSIDTLRSIESGRISAPNIFTVASIAKALHGDLNKWLK